MVSEQYEVINLWISAISAVGTVGAVVVALWLGQKEQRRSLKGTTIFEEKHDRIPSDQAADKEDVLTFGFNLVNTCNYPIYISYFIERGRLKRSWKSIAFLIRHYKQKRFTISGFRYGEGGRDIRLCPTEYHYTFPSIECIEPGKTCAFRFPFRYAKGIQECREEAGVFALNKRMKYYAVDVAGKRYKLSTAVTPNSFLIEKTCRMSLVNPFE